MVQDENTQVEGEIMTTRTIQENMAKGIEEGSYKLIGWAADTTGRRLIDEICQIATFTPESQFAQYIMPFSDIRLFYRRRHSIRVMNMGRYRMMKDLRTNKFVKTKSEITALTEFVQWLEDNRGEAKDGIILIFHEFQKSIPAMLLESLRRHKLSERFEKVVKGFANCFGLLQAKCQNTTKSFTLKVMSRVLLNKEEDISSAATRAQICFEIATHLSQSERNDLDSKGSGDANITNELLINMIRPFTHPVSAEEKDIKDLKILLDRQNTFKPVFGALLKATPVERQNASHLRRLLAENNLDYNMVKDAFEKDSVTGIEELLKAQITNVKEEELSELLVILDCFFDPEKSPVQPKPKFFQNNTRKFSRTKSESKDKNANEHPKDVKQEVIEIVDSPKVEIEKPIVKESIIKEPPIVEELKVEELKVEEPKVEKPVVEEPLVEKPVVEVKETIAEPEGATAQPVP